MKKTLLLCLLAVGILATSCEKEVDPKPALTKTEILAKSTWKLDEVWHNIDGLNKHYIRGTLNTTAVDYDVLRFTFKADGTGTHVDQFGVSHNSAWEFSTPDERNIKLTILDSSPVVYNWNLVEITDSAMQATVSIILDGGEILESFRLSPL